MASRVAKCICYISNLTSAFKEEKLQELQTVIVEMQQTIYKYEGTVRQFMIEYVKKSTLLSNLFVLKKR